MMAPTQPKVRSHAEWTVILDRIQADLARSLAQAPEPTPLPPPSDSTPTVLAPLTALDRRINELQSSLAGAERSGAETDALLHAESETIRLWTASIKQVREKLAKWVTAVK